MHYLSSVLFFVNQSLYISGIFVAQHQEVHCMYIRTQQLVRTVLKSRLFKIA